MEYPSGRFLLYILCMALLAIRLHQNKIRTPLIRGMNHGTVMESTALHTFSKIVQVAVSLSGEAPFLAIQWVLPIEGLFGSAVSA